MAKVIVLIATAAMLSGCASFQARVQAFMEPNQQSFCSAARPIYPDKKDVLTLPTTRLIVGHDEVGERLCGWKPPSAQ